MRMVKLIIGSLFAIAVMGSCGYLSYFFFTVSFLPSGLAILVSVICAIAVLVTLYLWIFSSVSILRQKPNKAQHHSP